ncbi:MAG TPA: encapsulin [Methanospirillum sp.]|nr:encapsulin [Methanospirillum sp.]
MSDTGFTKADLDRAIEFLLPELIKPLQGAYVARKIMAVNPNEKGTGLFRARVRQLGTMGGGTIAYKLRSNGERDQVSIKARTIDVPVLYKEFEIDRQDFDSYVNQGINLSTEATTLAMDVVASDEETMLLKSKTLTDSSEVIKGLYDSATSTIDTAYHLSTAGNAIKAIAAGIRQMRKKNVRETSFHWLLNPDEVEDISSTPVSGTTIYEMEQVIKALNSGSPNGPGSVWGSEDIPTGGGLLVPYDPSRKYFEILNPVEPSIELVVDPNHPDIGNIFGTVYEASIPYIKRPDCLYKFTDLN